MKFFPLIKTLLCLFFIGILTVLNAQNNKFEFGAKGAINYTTIGNSFGKYSGNSGYGLGLFGSYEFNPRFMLSLEPLVTSSSFREVQSDNKYRFTHIDLSVNGYVDLFKSDVFKFYFGVRPGYLLEGKSEKFEFGSYKRYDDPNNKNKNGQLDMAANVGLSLRLTKVLTLEAGYVWSVNNRSNATNVNGRPSFVEAALKLNAVDLKNVLESQDAKVLNQIKQYQKGVLLVMLQTPNEKKLAQKTAEQRKEITDKLNAYNQNIIRVFKQQYTFTPVYFFLDTSLKQVINGNFEKVFVNEQLKPETNPVIIQNNNYFIAGYCEDISNITHKMSYGFFVYDKNMTLLDRPFNISSQLTPQFFTFETQERTIKKFNGRMHRYSLLEP